MSKIGWKQYAALDDLYRNGGVLLADNRHLRPGEYDHYTRPMVKSLTRRDFILVREYIYNGESHDLLVLSPEGRDELLKWYEENKTKKFD